MTEWATVLSVWKLLEYIALNQQLLGVPLKEQDTSESPVVY